MDVKYNDINVTLPDFLIAGTARAGSTFLYETLSRHPEVFMPEEKEPNFLLAWDRPPFYLLNPELSEAKWMIHSLNEYSNAFSKAHKGALCGEATVNYLSGYQTVIQNIKKLYGQEYDKLKIIILLRNPVDRLWSHYVNKYSEKRECLDFDSAIDSTTIADRMKDGFDTTYNYVACSTYSDAVECYMKTFKHVKVFVFEEVFSDVEQYIRDVCEFLGIPFKKNIVKSGASNSSGKPRNKMALWVNELMHGNNILKYLLKRTLTYRQRRLLKSRLKGMIFRKWSLTPEKRDELFQLFSYDIERLGQILDRDFTLWRPH